MTLLLGILVGVVVGAAALWLFIALNFPRP